MLRPTQLSDRDGILGLIEASGQFDADGLVGQVEDAIRRRKARLLIVETSGLPAFAPARAFYPSCGFTLEATIRNFYADGDDKLVFTKSVTPGGA
ncbi:MAG: hypothetical protein SFV24_11960 [Gemmatimonadales bacterium]|nr:hypothetical protein [Gemmatimonadales bacterium]